MYAQRRKEPARASSAFLHPGFAEHTHFGTSSVVLGINHRLSIKRFRKRCLEAGRNRKMSEFGGNRNGCFGAVVSVKRTFVGQNRIDHYALKSFPSVPLLACSVFPAPSSPRSPLVPFNATTAAQSGSTPCVGRCQAGRTGSSRRTGRRWRSASIARLGAGASSAAATATSVGARSTTANGRRRSRGLPSLP